ncbi:hypothetical protein KY289_036791 [Solanum tuberosum]|nr:hypothetical protein KY284_036612 [Solanum tuberosum]KAH0636876.1 hypothetical protein KY289_036791 [Solanum tuberosum]
MRSQNRNIVIAITFVILLSSIPHEATSRILKEGGWRNRNKHLLLPSFYNPVRTPTPDPGTEGKAFSARTIEQKNFSALGRRVVVHPPPSYDRAFSKRDSSVS